jgi:hypothetical protein
MGSVFYYMLCYFYIIHSLLFKLHQLQKKKKKKFTIFLCLPLQAQTNEGTYSVGAIMQS